jgi:hypothetical protein
MHSPPHREGRIFELVRKLMRQPNRFQRGGWILENYGVRGVRGDILEVLLQC